MNALAALLGGVLGLIIGSFLNVIILRGRRGETLGGRSRCESCCKILSFPELVPIASFLIQHGRCRNCGSGLSWQYPLVELGTALSYASAAAIILANGQSPSALWFLGLAFIGIAALIVILASDLRFQIIPNGAVLILLILGVLAGIPKEYGAFLKDWAVALAFAGFLAALWFVSRGRWMGLGDAKLELALAAILGFPASVAALLFSFWIGGAAGAILLVSGQKTLKDRIPFGPFLILGALLAHFAARPFFALFVPY